MHIQIDQSGKIEDTSSDTIVAFSDGISKTIFLSKKEKRKIEKAFRENKKGHIFIFKTFAILIFLVIKANLHKIQGIEIDLEYSGRDVLIKDYLLRCIREHRSFDKRDIWFTKIGRKSRAHCLAIDVFRKKKKPDVVVSAKDVLRFL